MSDAVKVPWTVEIPGKTMNEFLAQRRALLASKVYLPVLAGVLVRRVGGEIRMSATDLDGALTVRVESEGPDTVGLVVMAEALVRASNLPGAKKTPWQISGVTGTLDCTIKIGAAEVTSHGLPAAEFPSMEGGLEPVGEPVLLTGQVTRAMGLAVAFASKEESRPILNSVCLQLTEGHGAKITATTGHLLFSRAVGGHGDAAADVRNTEHTAEYLIPPKTAAWIAARGAGGSVVMRTTQNEVGACFTQDAWSVYSRLVEGPYANYQQVIPKKDSAVVTLQVDDAAGLAAAFASAAKTAGRDKGTRVEWDAATGEAVAITAPYGDSAGGSMPLGKMAAVGKAHRVVIGLNFAYAATVLKQMAAAADKAPLFLTFQLPDRAIMVTSSTPDELVALVMPLMVDSEVAKSDVLAEEPDPIEVPQIEAPAPEQPDDLEPDPEEVPAPEAIIAKEQETPAAVPPVAATRAVPEGDVKLATFSYTLKLEVKAVDQKTADAVSEALLFGKVMKGVTQAKVATLTAA